MSEPKVATLLAKIASQAAEIEQKDAKISGLESEINKLRAQLGLSPLAVTSVSSRSRRSSSTGKAENTRGGKNESQLSSPVSNSLVAEYSATSKAISQSRAAAGNNNPQKRLDDEKLIVHEGLVNTYGLVQFPSIASLPVRLPVVHVLFLTTAPIETFALVRRLGPPPGAPAAITSAIQVSSDPWVYYVGTLSGQTVVVVKSSQGTGGPESATPTTAAAIAQWSPRLVLAVGIAFGVNPHEFHYGDVVVAAAVFPYDARRVGQDNSVIYSNPLRHTHKDILEAFSFKSLGATTLTTATLPDGSKLPSRVSTGLFVSGSVLADSSTFVEGLLAGVNSAVQARDPEVGAVMAGEMEGSGLYDAAMAAGVPVGLIKSISDFGGLDGVKTKEAQPYAAVAAVAVVERALANDSGEWVRKLPIAAGRGLVTMDFSVFIGDKVSGFVGRKQLYADVDAWRRTGKVRGADAPKGSVILVTGDPGVGKSAWLAGLVSFPKLSDPVAAYHFCRYDVPETLEARGFLSNVTKRLLERFSAEGVDVPGSAVEAVTSALVDSSKKVPDTFATFLRALPKSISAPGTPWLIAVDSLDEAADAGGSSGREIVACLTAAVTVLPSWLRIVATTRKDETVLKRLLPPLRAVSIEASSEENLADITEYIKRKFSSSKASQSDVKGVVTASGGNFLYVRQLLEWSSPAEVVQRVSAGTLPEGLLSLYGDLGRRLFKTQADFEAIVPALSALVAGIGPVPKFLLSRVAAEAGLDKSIRVDDVVRTLSSVLETTEDTVRIYHKSFVDWLTQDGWRADVGSLKSVRINPIEGHRAWTRLGKQYWAYKNEKKWTPKDWQYHARGSGWLGYSIRHVVEHATRSDDDEMKQWLHDHVLMNWEWIRLRTRYDGFSGLGDDLFRAVRFGVRTDDATYELSVLRRLIGQFQYRSSDGDLRPIADLILYHLTGSPRPNFVRLVEDVKAQSENRIMSPLTGHQLNQALEMTVGGHSSYVNTVTTIRTADKKRFVVSGSSDRSVRVWETKHWEQVWAWDGFHDGWVTSVDTLPPPQDKKDEADLVVSVASEDSKFGVWSVSGGSKVGEGVTGWPNGCNAVAGLTSSSFVVGGQNGKLCVFVNDKVDGRGAWSKKPKSEWKAHAGWIGAVTRVTGTTFLSGARDFKVSLWNTSGDELQTFKGHTREIRTIAVSWDKKKFLSAGRDEVGIVWDLSSGTQLSKLHGHRGAIRGATWAPDPRGKDSGMLVVTAGEDKTVRLWDPSRGVAINRLDGHTRGVLCVTYSGGRRIVTGAREGVMNVWTLNSLFYGAGSAPEVGAPPDRSKRRGRRSSPRGGVGAFRGGVGAFWGGTGRGAFRRNGAQRGGSTARSKSPAPPTPPTMSGSADRSSADYGDVHLVFPIGRHHVATATNDAVIRIWPRVLPYGFALSSIEPVAELEGHGRNVNGLLSLGKPVAGKWPQLLSVGGDGSMILWTPTSADGKDWTSEVMSPASRRAGGGDGRSSSRAGRDRGKSSKRGGRAGGGGREGGRGADQDRGTGWNRGSTGLNGLSLSSNGKYAATVGDDANVRFWEMVTEKGEKHPSKLQQYCSGYGGRQWMMAVAWIDDEHVATGSNDGTVRVWSSIDGSEVAYAQGHTAGLWDMLSIGANRFASASRDNTIVLWRLNKKMELELEATLEGSQESVLCMDRIGDSGVIASGSWDKRVRLWDVNSGVQIGVLDVVDVVRDVAWSADREELVVSSDQDFTVFSIDLEALRKIVGARNRRGIRR